MPALVADARPALLLRPNPVDPGIVGNQWGRWKADAGTWTTTGKTTAAVADGDPVGAWVDQWGKGTDLLQATAGKRPALKLNVLGIKPAMLFDGITQFLLTAGAWSPTLSPPYTCYCVAQCLNIAANAILLDATSAKFLFYTPTFIKVPGVRWEFYAGGGDDFPYATPDLNWHVFVVQVQDTAARPILCTDGAQALIPHVDSAQAFAALSVAATTGGASNMNCRVAEILLYSAAHEPGLMRSIQRYLSDYWGVPL